MKLREGNFFTRVCLSVDGGVPCDFKLNKSNIHVGSCNRSFINPLNILTKLFRISNTVGEIGDLSNMQPVPLSAQVQVKFWRELWLGI